MNELRYGMIKYNRKEKTFIIFDGNRNMTYDSRVLFLGLKALCLKAKTESDEIYKFEAYMKPLMNTATDRNTFITDNYQFYFNKLLTSKGIEIQNDVLTQETVKANGKMSVSAIIGIMRTFLWYIIIWILIQQ